MASVHPFAPIPSAHVVRKPSPEARTLLAGLVDDLTILAVWNVPALLALARYARPIADRMRATLAARAPQD